MVILSNIISICHVTDCLKLSTHGRCFQQISLVNFCSNYQSNHSSKQNYGEKEASALCKNHIPSPVIHSLCQCLELMYNMYSI